jgi:hypothetical protein
MNSWSPKVVGELNGQHVKLAKVRGESGITTRMKINFS